MTLFRDKREFEAHLNPDRKNVNMEGPEDADGIVSVKAVPLKDFLGTFIPVGIEGDHNRAWKLYRSIEKLAGVEPMKKAERKAKEPKD